VQQTATYRLHFVVYNPSAPMLGPSFLPSRRGPTRQGMAIFVRLPPPYQKPKRRFLTSWLALAGR
jgi:hypothetical protein